MARRTARIVGTLLLIPFLGCFEIKEIVKFNKDGSGSFSFQVGIQEQFRAFMAMSRKMQKEKEKQAEEKRESTEGGDEILDPEMAELEREEAKRKQEQQARKPAGDFEQARKKMASVPGISNVRVLNDEDNFRFGIHFDFADIAALNRALHRLPKKTPPKEVAYFQLSGGMLERKPIVGFQEDLQKQMTKGKEGKPDFNPAMLGIKFLYITEYTFEREVRKVSNPRAQVLGDKRTVRMEHSMLDPAERESNVGNKIQLKRWYHTCLPFL